MLMFLLAFLGGTANATKINADLAQMKQSTSATWDAETFKLGWTQGWYNSVDIVGLPTGDLSAYTSLVIGTTEFGANTTGYRVLFYYGASNVPVTVSSQDQTVINLAETLTPEQRAGITRICVAGTGGSEDAPCSVKFSKIYMVKPFDLVFDTNGKAVILPSDLTASGGVSYDEDTGALTAGATAGSLSVDLPSEGVDLNSVYGFKINYTGDNVMQKFVVANAAGWSKDFWSRTDGRDDLAQHIKGNGKNTNKWEWTTNAYTDGEQKTMTISSIELYAKVLTCNDPHYADLTRDMFHNWTGAGADATATSTVPNFELHLNETMGQGATLYGDGGVYYLNYADVTGYDKIVFYGVGTGQYRLLCNRETDNGTHAETLVDVSATGVTEVSVADLDKNGKGYVHLNAIKLPWGDNTATLTAIKLYKETVAEPYSLVLSGEGVLTSDVAALLAKDYTSVDATGLTNDEAIEIATGNPNCLLVTTAGKLSNSQNVVVGGTCANLVLADANNYASPIDFTAASATFSRKAKGYQGWSTVCVPFDAEVPAGVKAWTVAGVTGSVLNMAEATVIPANTPVLVQFDEETGLRLTASGVSIAKTAAPTANGNGLVGVYTKQQAPVGCYVLQSQEGTLGFYKVTEAVRPNVPAFRAYLNVVPASAKYNSFSLKFSEPTGIDSLDGTDGRKTAVARYNTAGQRVNTANGSLEIRRMSDGSVRKVMVR